MLPNQHADLPNWSWHEYGMLHWNGAAILDWYTPQAEVTFAPPALR